MQVGYKLAAEAFGPAELVRQAMLAEEAGFDSVEISSHFHPWLDNQGHSPFAWTVLGSIAAKTSRIGLATGVTCPTVRYHPAVVAQAAGRSPCCPTAASSWLSVRESGRTSTSSVRVFQTRSSPGTKCSRRRWRSSGCCGAGVTGPTRASICGCRTPGSSTRPTRAASDRRSRQWPHVGAHRR